MTSSSMPYHPQSPQIALGTLVHQARNEQALGVPEVARALILSIAQIKGIESGLLTAFHNKTYYVRAIKKYIDYLGLTEQDSIISLLAAFENESAQQENETMLLVGSVLQRSGNAPFISTRRLGLFVLAIVIASGVGSFVIMSAGKSLAPSASLADSQKTPVRDTPLDIQSTAAHPSVSQAPEKQNNSVEPVQIAAPIQSEAAVMAAQPVVPPTASESKMLILKFAAESWIQFADREGKRSEKIFKPTDTLEIDPLNLSLLVIGNAPETSVYFGESRLELGKYINMRSSVARLNQQDLNALTSP